MTEAIAFGGVLVANDVTLDSAASDIARVAEEVLPAQSAETRRALAAGRDNSGGFRDRVVGLMGAVADQTEDPLLYDSALLGATYLELS